MDDDTRRVIEALEQRVRALEDHLALYQAVSTYGPAVDSLLIDDATALWTDDGVYDAMPGRPLNGRDAIGRMLDSAMHRDLVEGGCAHVMSMPVVHLDGDRAVAIGYHRLFTRNDAGYQINRLTVSRWDFQRTAEGWKAVRRTHRLLDGAEQGAEAKQLLAATLREILDPRTDGKSDASNGVTS